MENSVACYSEVPLSTPYLAILLANFKISLMQVSLLPVTHTIQERSILEVTQGKNPFPIFNTSWLLMLHYILITRLTFYIFSTFFSTPSWFQFSKTSSPQTEHFLPSFAPMLLFAFSIPLCPLTPCCLQQVIWMSICYDLWVLWQLNRWQSQSVSVSRKCLSSNQNIIE